MKIRRYKSSDCAEIAQMFYDTIHSVNAKDYSQKQLDVWADGNVDLTAWNKSFLAHYTLVAEVDGVIAGFGDIDRDYLDRLYVHKDYQGIGIATALVTGLEEYSISMGYSNFSVHASITAKPFFEKMRYVVINEQQVERGGVLLTNFVMAKNLGE